MLLTEELADLWENPKELERQIEPRLLDLKSYQMPGMLLASLSGKELKNNKVKGTLTVSITAEVNPRNTAGMSEAEMSLLAEKLNQGQMALALLAPKDTQRAFGIEPYLLSDYNPQDNSYLARTERAKDQRLSGHEISQRGIAWASAEIGWTSDVASEGFPADFTFKETLIKPGQYAFLALPFERQGRGGICTAASALNILRFIDPTIALEQTELFSMYDSGKSGASQREVIQGLKGLGFEAEVLDLQGSSRTELIRKVRASLDAGIPLLAATSTHALTIIGYDKSRDKLIAWDQRMSDKGKPPTLPDGAFEMSDSAIAGRFKQVMAIRKTESLPTATEMAVLTGILGQENISRHQIGTGALKGYELTQYLKQAAPAKLQSLLRTKKTPIIISVGARETELIAIESQNEKVWEVQRLPSKVRETLPDTAVWRLLTENAGVLFSIENETPAPALSGQPNGVNTGFCD
jgi:hypothetical protein